MMSADEASAHRWSEFSHPVFNFACVLRAADLMPDDENDWEKPQKWDREHRLWTEAGEPANPSVGAPAPLAWERFLRAATYCG
jgi:hypothetical protein